MRKIALKISLIAAIALSLSACATHRNSRQAEAATASESHKPLIRLGGRNKANDQAGIGVNAYLWRATLDTLNFMPIATADPFGGTYVTEWHSNANAPTERFKIQVFILDTRLRADGIAVQVFKQVNSGGNWVDANVDPDTPLQIENAILTRARQLRIANLESGR